MSRKLLAAILAAASMAALLPSVSLSQTKAQKIASALSAAPATVAANAGVIDWPDKVGKMASLKEGTNGWTCLPSQPKTKYNHNNSMCGDAAFMTFMGEMMSNKPPTGNSIGYSYMLSTDDWESNIDAKATAPAANNDWHHVGPHVMIRYPDLKMLDGLPTHPSKTSAYVMWPGTPYAHVMFPVK